MCVFSKIGYVHGLKSKSAANVTNTFEREILKDGSPNFVQTDSGKEFLNGTFQSMLRRYGIKHYTTDNREIKAACVERFNRTVKTLIWKYISYSGSNRYIHVLPEIVRTYNSRYHRSIGMAPVQVNSENADEVAARLYPKKPKTFVYKFNVGDTVRISMARATFGRGFTKQWTTELFEITDRYPTVPVTYGLRDLDSEPIKGRFYQQELIKVSKPSGSDYYAVEKILKTRKRRGKTEYFVKWQGYPDKFNSWTNQIRPLQRI